MSIEFQKIADGGKVETVQSYAASMKAELKHVAACGAGLRLFTKRIDQVAKLGIKCVEFIGNNDAKAQSLMTVSSLGMMKARKLAAENVDQSIENRGLAMKAAGDRVVADVSRSVLKQISEESASPAQRAANRWREAMIKLENEVEGARVEALGPAALRADASEQTLKSIMAQASLTAELRARGVRYIAEQYRSAVKVGDDDRAKAIKDSSRIFLIETMSTPRPKLAAVAAKGFVAGETDLLLLECRRLLSEYDQADFAAIPPEIPAAQQLYEELKKLFRDVCGVNVKLMTRGEFAQRFMGENSRLDTGLDIEASWPIRHLQASPQNLKLPGWASVLGRNNSFEALRNARPSVS
jgi:hypothetical protein